MPAVLISTEQGNWRWRTDTTAPYTIFDVANEDETFEESNQSIEIVSIDDANMTLIENAEGTDEEGILFLLVFVMCCSWPLYPIK